MHTNLGPRLSPKRTGSAPGRLQQTQTTDAPKKTSEAPSKDRIEDEQRFESVGSEGPAKQAPKEGETGKAASNLKSVFSTRLRQLANAAKNPDNICAVLGGVATLAATGAALTLATKGGALGANFLLTGGAMTAEQVLPWLATGGLDRVVKSTEDVVRGTAKLFSGDTDPKNFGQVTRGVAQLAMTAHPGRGVAHNVVLNSFTDAVSQNVGKLGEGAARTFQEKPVTT